MKNTASPYYIGLDVGTDSAGYAVTNENYELMKFKGEPMWGVHLFEEAALNNERRSFRTARRRLDRRQQRVRLVQELFAREIARVDEHFFIRIKESALFPEDTAHGAGLFNDPDFHDSDYHKQYPTIHHLIMELIENGAPHDVRLVYLAVAWLVAHRGHFLNEISRDNLSGAIDIGTVYRNFEEYFEQKPWECGDIAAFGEILKKKGKPEAKSKELSQLLFGALKAPKNGDNAAFPYDREAILKLMCGGKVKCGELFRSEEYAQIESFSLDKSDDELAPILGELGDDAELILRIKSLYDWAVLSDALHGERYISKAKIGVYEQHEKDLKKLKYLIKKYVPQKYDEAFREAPGKNVNYEAYAKGGKQEKQKKDESEKKQKDTGGKHEKFCEYIKELLKNVNVKTADIPVYNEIVQRAEDKTLCPKQVNSDNRVIPYQAYWAELKAILDNACKYLSFLNEKDESGYSAAEKLLSIFEFRIPYFVGPLNRASEKAWIVRKADGPLYPWNFSEKVDLEASEQAFIDRMTNSCTYLPGEDVLPKMSLCYEKFQMLNEINPISVNGKRLPPELKQELFSELCMKRKKITKKAIKDYLRANNHYTAEELETLGGIDDNIKSSLVSHMAFRNLLESGKLSEADAERIIERRTYTESKARFSLWLNREYSGLAEADRDYICALKFRDFGRLSRELLRGLYGAETGGDVGGSQSILQRMWNENLTLMEILSDAYTYAAQIELLRADYFGGGKKSLDERLQDMYLSNAVKRPIIRVLEIVGDVVKANGGAPKKIFIEMARGGKPEEKGKRTASRKAQIEALYEKCDTEDARVLSEQLAGMGAAADSRLQSDKLFLYYMQFGKCMYTGEPIDISHLSDKRYDIDHIYPRSKVKDDSVLNNKVLTLSTANADKGDVYPIQPDVRKKMAGWWKELKERGAITEEKYRRLTRREPFSESEQWGFINRQLVETRQSTKALAAVLGELYPESRIVYVKAGLVSEFRQEFDMLKSRAVNDLHHAKDAYLNIAVGNVYDERFSRQWFLANRETYNLKVKTLFDHPVKVGGRTVWNGKEDLSRVKNTVYRKNAVHLTRYAFCSKGGFFKQQPCSAAEGLFPRKKNLPTEKYGGYTNTAASFFLLVKYAADKKKDLMCMPVELLFADRVMNDGAYAAEYAKDTISKIIKKPVQSLEFPLGMRKLKIGTVFEFDGCFRAYLTRKSSGGKQIGISTFSPLIVGYEWEKYIKRLERLAEKAGKTKKKEAAEETEKKKKKKENSEMQYVYSELYDKVSVSKNAELYDLLTGKLQSGLYEKRRANPVEVLEKGKEQFQKLDIFEQTKCLLQILKVFGRSNTGSDLRPIGGNRNNGIAMLNVSLSNWKKYYTDVRIVDMSASGLYQSKSDNLLELL